jgi:hypothetical protein
MKPNKWVLGLALLATAQAQFKQQGGKLVASDSTQQGYSVALSADGNTALVGAPQQMGAGAAFVYTRSGSVWTQQGGKLFGTGGDSHSEQGSSVALSADGNTALVGGPGDNTNTGAAWVFTRSGGVWTQQGNKLVGSGAVGAAQGWSVALSADGNTALVGAPNDNNGFGTVWIFTHSSGVWTQQGAKLVGSGGIGSPLQGQSVALSADGNTALIGGPVDNPDPFGHGAGAAWVFTRTGSTWTQQGSKLVGGGAIGHAEQGLSVALSADGNTALIGGNQDNGNTGALWVFTRSAGTWTQQGSKLVGSGVSGTFATQGYSVAVSADGNLAVSGAIGAGSIWVFKRSGGVWAQQGSKLEGSGAVGPASQGWSVAISAIGTTVIVGGSYDAYGTGAAWVFARPQIRDFDGDGRSDALLYDAATGTAYTALSNGDGTFHYVYNLFTSGFDVLRTGDFNGDGKTDLALYNSRTGLGYIGMSNGDGTFTFQSLFWSPGFDQVEAADLNGDGKTDVVLYNSSTGALYTGISDGTGTFAYRYLSWTPHYNFLRVADFTGHGHGDLLLLGPPHFSGVLFGDGAGGFSSFYQFPRIGDDFADTGDLNADGITDLLLYNSAFGSAATGISNGNSFVFTPLFFSPGFTSVYLADYSGNSKADVTLYNKLMWIGYFGTGNGAGNFTFQPLFWGPGFDTVVPQDMNADGKTDILLYRQSTGTAYVGLSYGDGTFAYTYSTAVSGCHPPPYFFRFGYRRDSNASATDEARHRALRAVRRSNRRDLISGSRPAIG